MDPFVAEIRMFAFNFAPRGCRLFVTANCCLCLRTQHCSRWLVLTMAATVRAPLRSQTFRDLRRSIRVTDRVLVTIF